ncbi:cAMP-binding domain of CRP or a regulatory subunit of cAMP-dependent protein kinases [Pseudomonas citronellolis]|jgi:CRP-like cAMP-binding protein|uniref:Crp/Fnr family transcriptional regulator n=1 Tax=Pseudomonas citronellolis TaxID=53408 RepID=A0A127N1M5_9PSED|nr:MULTISPECIES: Crp/Fnr family transcriptional regulator [Pseudomonas]KSW25274.1 Crp/Fnr family transcriptional regulator [Pseudomonas sp. ADP]AMO79360.1 cAMP receptor protein [Pseudomonas citronellolis]ANI18073.1 Crp/Fnr family transcriptional regulator [Pseudomonas citronellolis]KRV73516.1 Crp/Fnr family transcriptional regulator [Pseudomonas citronellolis]KRW79414.1 Crp/Fnr family transcriptional regulator [Pseudomonas citronellolis]
MPDTADCLQRIASGRWFQHLPAELREALGQAAIVRRLPAGQRLFARGDAPCGLYCVVEGRMRVGAVGASGKEALLALVEAPNWFGEICLFDGQPRTHDAYAEGPTTLLQVPLPALHALLAEKPQYWRDFALLMSHKLRLAFTVLEEQALLPAAQRLARRLLMLAASYGEAQASQRELHLPQEQLAAMLGLSRQTTNHLLKELEARGVLRLSYAGIEILDAHGLRLAAGEEA